MPSASAVIEEDMDETDCYHYSNVIMSALASQFTGVSIDGQPFVQAKIKENI